MSIVWFGDDRQLSIAVEAPNGLHRGAGVHRLTFPARLDGRNTMTGGVSVDVRGDAWLGSGGGDWLGRITSTQPVITSDTGPFDASILLALTDEQLTVIEDRRCGSDVTFRLDVWLTLGFDPAVAQGDANRRWPSKLANLEVLIQSGPWSRLLAQVGAGVSLAVVVPIPLNQHDAKSTQAGHHLREAIRKVNAGEYADAAVAARRALDVLNDHWPTASAVMRVERTQRTLEQRLGLLHYSLASLAGAAPHGDATASSIVWDRTKALAVISAVASLAACAQ